MFNSSLAESSGVCQVVTLPNKGTVVYPVTIVLMCNMNRYFEVIAGYSILLLQLQLRDAWNSITVSRFEWPLQINMDVMELRGSELLMLREKCRATAVHQKTKITNRRGQTDSSTRTKLPLWSGTW